MKITNVDVLTIPDRGDCMMLVVVDTGEGIHGLGEVGVRTRQEALRGALVHLREILIGQNATRIEHLWQVLTRSGFFPATASSTPPSVPSTSRSGTCWGRPSASRFIDS